MIRCATLPLHYDAELPCRILRYAIDADCAYAGHAATLRDTLYYAASMPLQETLLMPLLTPRADTTPAFAITMPPLLRHFR